LKVETAKPINELSGNQPTHVKMSMPLIERSSVVKSQYQNRVPVKWIKTEADERAIKS